MKVMRILVYLISLVICQNASAYDYEYNGFYFNLNAVERTATVTYKTTSYNSYSGIIDIPDYFPGPKDIEYTVVAIGNNAFKGCTSVKKLVIPNTVTEIGDNAFEGCTGITTVTLPQMVTSIGRYAFSNCTFLSSVRLPDFMTTISANMFENCKGLTSVVIPRNVTTIEASAFSGCTGLVSVSLPSGISSIGNNAFYNCSNLSEIVLPNDLSSIGSAAFYGCSKLSTLSITSGVQSIGQSAFSNTGIKSLVYEEGCTTALRTYATSITEVKLASTIKNIPESAFYDCTLLTSVDIPKNVSVIGNSAFYGCTSLSKLYLPSSVKTIGSNAFALTGIKLLEYAEGCNIALRTYATEIISVIIPSSIISFENDAFAGCRKLENIHIYNLELWNYIMRNQKSNPFECPHRIYNNGNVLISLNADFGCEIAKYAFSNCIGLKYVNLTPSISNVGDYAFSGCPDLETVVIGSGVENIGVNAFQGCTSLQSVRLGSGVKKINDNAFYGCKMINSLLFGGNEERIGKSVFTGCSSLPTISLPATITAIGSAAFQGCVALQSVKLPNGITTIEDYTFDGCVEMQSAEMSSALTSIGKYAFRNCDRLHTIELPDIISTIDDYSFNDCDSLTYIYIGSGIRSIGSYSFANSKRIVGFYCRATERPSCQSTAFSNSDPEYIDLYVPDESVNSYSSESPWNIFGSKRGLSSAPKFVTDISLSSPVVILEEGETKKLSATVNPADATNTRVYWSSSNSAVAYVNSSGTILANEQGTATITVKAADNNGAVARSLVFVSNNFKPLTDIKLSHNEVALQEGKKLLLSAEVKPIDATYSGVTWNSSNPDVALVGSDGVVKALKTGTAEITCSAADGNGAVAICSIEVIPSVDPVIGDANEDGRVSVSDISHVANVILSYTQKNPNFSIYDINDDGEITISDITGIASIILNGGLESKVKLLELPTKKMTIGINETKLLNKTVIPYKSHVAYQSSNPAVATVDDLGNITGVSGGTAIIKVSAMDGSGLSSCCEVTVDSSYGLIDEHSFIDLGLPSGTRWATTNLGASISDEYGQYYAWGETNTKENYSWNTYKHSDGTANSLTKYCNAASKGTRDNLMQLQSADDAVVGEWGDEWCTPTRKQFEELYNSVYTTWIWEEHNGIYGYKVTSKMNGNSIFLPAAGYRNQEDLYSSDFGGYYSTKDLYEEDASCDWIVHFGRYKMCEINKTYRAYGQSVRPVRSAYIKMSETEMKMTVFDEHQLFAHVEGKDSLSKISWRSEDESIATVTVEGIVKGISHGQTRIYAESENGICAYCSIEIGIIVNTIILDDNNQPPLVAGMFSGKANIIKRGFIVNEDIDYAPVSNATSFLTEFSFDSEPINGQKAILCEAGKEQFSCRVLFLKGHTYYYITAFVIGDDGSVFYGNTTRIYTSFRRRIEKNDYANVYNNNLLFDLMTDEIISESNYICSTNERPHEYWISSGGRYYKFKTVWNYNLWYHRIKLNQYVTKPEMTYDGTKLHISASSGCEIYYQIDGDGMRPENFTKKYTDPIVINQTCMVHCYAKNSQGATSYVSSYYVMK